MTDSQKREFLSSLGALFEMFGQEATTPRITLYWLAMRSECSLDAAKDAMAKSARTASRLPTVAELLEHVNGKPSDRAEAAWFDVQRSTGISYMADLDFEDRSINAVIRALGGRRAFFERLGAGVESEKWLRIEFMKSYAAFADRALSDEATGVLFGDADRGEVLGRSYQPRLEVVRCDQERAKLMPPREPVACIGSSVGGELLVFRRA